MTAAADPVLDPVGTVVGLVIAADPALDQGTARQVAERAAGGRAKRRRLAAALASDPSVLATGRSPAPRAVGDLLLALRAAGAAGISPPRCAGCGREVTSMQRRGNHWYCSPCFGRPLACAACGNQRQVASRDRHGRPRCCQCPDQDTRDPRDVLTEVITTADPGLAADVVTAALEATVVKPAHLQKLAWALQESPALLTGGGAKAPFPMVLRLIGALCDAGATRIQRPPCPRCGRVVALSKLRDGLRVCRACCARANAVPCGRCGTVREPAARDERGRPVCPHCLSTDPANLERCARCGRRRPVSTRTSGGAVCPTCVPRKILACTICGQARSGMVSRITGQPWCRACARSWAPCSHCGQPSRLRAGTREMPLCGSCAAPGTEWKSCPGCGAGERLVAGACRRCHLHQQLRELLADPAAGRVRAGLQVLQQALAGIDRPEIALGWLRRPKVRALLTELAAGQRPLTHAALDDLPPSKTLTHLRSVLVGTGALPGRDEHLAQLERWIGTTVAARLDPGQKEVLHRYAVWHVLRRLRHRLRGRHATPGQAAVARRNVQAAVSFLDWLAAGDTTLASCTQASLDEWMAAANLSQRGPTGNFVRWARNQGLTTVDFPATRWGGPARVIDTEARWEQARWLLHDDSVRPEDRAAGLLVLLYAQQPAAISRLTLGHVQAGGDQVRLMLGREPVVLPEPLASLILQVAATRRGHAVIGDRGSSPWLLPGGRPGQPISPYRLAERLHQIGIHPGPARSTALFQLATELPAAILARMLGIHIKVAVAWQHACAGDWMTYAAGISHRLEN
ncbi:MAG: hypothetical protein ACHP9Z_16120 [Streptosporangiales bacterium]